MAARAKTESNEDNLTYRVMGLSPGLAKGFSCEKIYNGSSWFSLDCCIIYDFALLSYIKYLRAYPFEMEYGIVWSFPLNGDKHILLVVSWLLEGTEKLEKTNLKNFLLNHHHLWIIIDKIVVTFDIYDKS